MKCHGLPSSSVIVLWKPVFITHLDRPVCSPSLLGCFSVVCLPPVLLFICCSAMPVSRYHRYRLCSAGFRVSVKNWLAFRLTFEKLNSMIICSFFLKPTKFVTGHN